MVGSPVHLTKTIMNLVSNAVEAMPDGGTVRISTANKHLETAVNGFVKIPQGDYVMLEVTDTGVGIAPEDIDKIFEPFYTKKKMGRSGTGLGMAVVWGTVKDHKGYINIDSVEGRGTCFQLYFPATEETPSEKRSDTSIDALFGHGESILIVDDGQEQREILSALLTQLKYTVHTAEDGRTAVEYMRNNRADLLIVDMIMDPGIDGLDTYRKILKIHPHQRAIIVSGYSETGRVQEALKIGADAYIKKPYSIVKLGRAVKSALAQQNRAAV